MKRIKQLDKHFEEEERKAFALYVKYLNRRLDHLSAKDLKDTRAIRGGKTKSLLSDSDTKKIIKMLAGRIASGEIDYKNGSEEMCNICKLVREKKIIS